MKGFKNFFFSWIFPWVPKRLMSRTVGVFMRIPIPPPLGWVLIPLFAKLFSIDMSEAECRPGSYRTLNAFFTRKLKPGARPLAPSLLVHPVDGQLTEHGMVQSGQLIQVKDWTYDLSEFLGERGLALAFEGGHFYTYYLCPADYHRVHAPTEGLLVSARHIPGLLWPVNEWSVNNVRRLFNLNERVILNFDSPHGRWSLVMVGATNVGKITVSLDPSITTNRWMWHAPTDRRYSPPVPVAIGEELGVFHLGSTVVCVFEKSFHRSLGGARSVQMGTDFFI
jgi:phosphatidylserine decarboxylase